MAEERELGLALTDGDPIVVLTVVSSGGDVVTRRKKEKEAERLAHACMAILHCRAFTHTEARTHTPTQTYTYLQFRLKAAWFCAAPAALSVGVVLKERAGGLSKRRLGQRPRAHAHTNATDTD